MADLSDVEVSLWTLINSIAYPDGTPDGSPRPASPVIGFPVVASRAWPDADRLDIDLAAGIVTVTVFTMAGHSRTTNRYIDDWRAIASPPATLTSTTAGTQVTFAGVGGPGQIAGILIGGTAYSVLANGSAADAVAALAAMVPGASAEGAVLTLPTNLFSVEIGAPINEEREVRRQIQGFRMIVWCPSTAARDAASGVIDAAMAVYDEDFIPLRDGTGGLLRYAGTLPDDVPSKANLWKRTLSYMVEYPTMQRRTSPPILFPGTSVTLSVG